MVRKLGSEEKALCGRVMATVKPLHPVAKTSTVPNTEIKTSQSSLREAKLRAEGDRRSTNPELVQTNPGLPRSARNDDSNQSISTVIAKPTPLPPKAQTLDGTWDRQITKGAIIPDVSVDLHGSGLASAYARLDGALEQAIAQKLRVVLLVTGHQRAHDRASGEGRGAIASVVRDWLAASRHSSAIAAVRNAHPRHGGAGALYIVLKR
jgi:DNA-nicking Smr family endonuclease